MTNGHERQQPPNFCPHPADLSVPPAWQGRSVAGPKLRLVNMAAFVELTVRTDMFTANAVRMQPTLLSWRSNVIGRSVGLSVVNSVSR